MGSLEKSTNFVNNYPVAVSIVFVLVASSSGRSMQFLVHIVCWITIISSTSTPGQVSNNLPTHKSLPRHTRYPAPLIQCAPRPLVGLTNKEGGYLGSILVYVLSNRC